MTTPPVCDYTDSDYQTTFWEKGGRAYEDACEAITLQKLLPKRGSYLLELGAGAGRNTPRYTGYDKITLLDYSRTQLEQARARLGESPRYRFVAADVYRLPFVDACYDGATMIRTLHHMKDAPAALTQVRRVLTQDATFILEYANKRNVKSILRYLLGRQKWSPYTIEPVEYLELNFDFHPRAIQQWMTAAGFRIERTITVSHFRVGFLKRVIPTSVLAFFDSLAGLTGDLWQLSPSVFLRATLQDANPLNSKKTEDACAFACPACSTPLKDTPPEIKCPGCRRKYPFQEGIYDFRLSD